MASRNFNWPAITTTSGPIQYVLDGVVTTVSEDTVTPANSTPLPVTVLDPVVLDAALDYGPSADALRTAAQIGNATGAAAFGAGTTSAQTLRVVLPTDQSEIPVHDQAFSDKTAAGLVPEAFDYQLITYVGATTDISTVTYKIGGAGGTTVATLTMGYDGSNRLQTVTKT